jgi:hypothetical protein
VNIGTVARTALKAVKNESIESRLLVSKKIIKDLEDLPNEASFRLCRDLRAVLKSVTKDPQASADQIGDAGSLLARTRDLDPRSNPKEEDEPVEQESTKPEPPPKISDGFEPGFLDPIASVARVVGHYGSTRPRWTPLENERLLQVALGSIPLDAHSVVQLWLGLSYDFKTRLNFDESSVFPQSLWITAAICQYVNTRHIYVPRANCFTNVIEEVSFRA